MMFNEGAALKWLVAIGLVISFVLWAFRLIPWWGIFVGGVAAPAIVVAGLVVFGLLAWMASGSR